MSEHALVDDLEPVDLELVEDLEPVDDFEGVAVVGMAGRFPGARDLDELWRNLAAGVESIDRLSDAALRAAGVAENRLADPRYVRAAALLDGVADFDADYFGLTPREAELLDPQHRLFLEHAHAALEDAGTDPRSFAGAIGVYGGSSRNTYRAAGGDDMRDTLAGDRDFLTTRVSYLLDLTGPSLDLQTACSTSLVAVAMAYQALLSYQCDLVLAGGVSVHVPQEEGYLYREQGILSPDGHCRPFDAAAAGTVRGSGVGVVALKRLEDALEDGDTVRAVIRGAAVNNDGAAKVGYAAPGVRGQARVVAQAHALAAVDPRTVTYVEAHGTATALGDPIEVEALTQAFRQGTEERGFCALGSVKSNFGHLDAAAGIAGLIKTVLALEHRRIPPSLHFEHPNPDLGLEASPFFVNDRPRPLEPAPGAPRRAGVSSFGIGGTNAHVVLEEAPEPEPAGLAGFGRPWHLLVLSAKSESALDAVTARLADHLEHTTELELADVAHTLRVGRGAHACRRTLVGRDLPEVIGKLRGGELATVCRRPDERSLVYLLPGQGSLSAPVARQLHAAEPVFRREVDRCAERLAPELGLDLRDPLLRGTDAERLLDTALRDTALAQPALFVLELALARLWQAWGAAPAALLGHSLGEITAACLAEVLSLEDALGLVAARGQLMRSTATGAMLAVALAETEVAPLVGGDLALAAVNGPRQCVVSGPPPGLETLAAELAERGVKHRRLTPDRAFHSPLMEPVLDAFRRRVAACSLAPPRVPFLSNVSGTWITDEEATDPDYWVRHLRRTVRFDDGLARALELPGAVFLEVGPGRTLGNLVRHRRGEDDIPVLASLPATANSDELSFLLESLGQLWLAGVEIDWPALSADERRRRVPLPTYPFERRRFWAPSLAPPSSKATVDAAGFDLTAAVPRLDESASRLARELGSASFRVRCAALDPLAASAVYEYFRDGGVDTSPGRAWSPDELRRRLGVGAGRRRFFDFLTEVLVEDGILERRGEGLVFTDAGPALLAADSLAERLAAEHPDLAETGRLVRHCARHYGPALRGEVPAISVLYPAGRPDLLRRAAAHDDAYGSTEVLTRLALEVVELARQNRGTKTLRGTETLRVLEAGAGQGLLTRRVLPQLTGHDVDYRFTDLGRAFLVAAERQPEIGGHPGVRCEHLDISRDPLSQGFTAGGFDLVLAANVIHATPDLRRSLGHLRALLAPGALLVVLELVRTQRWSEMVWGLTDGWWSFTDRDLRQDSPLLSFEGWERLLEELDFASHAVFPRPPEARQDSDMALLVAQSPAGAQPASARPATAVPAPEARPLTAHSRPPMVTRYLAPRTDLERIVAALWQRALGIDRVGIRDNFFDLGGDSITGLEILDHLRRQLDTELPAVSLYEHPTVQSIAELLAENGEATPGDETTTGDEATTLDPARRIGERKLARLRALRAASGRPRPGDRHEPE